MVPYTRKFLPSAFWLTNIKLLQGISILCEPIEIKLFLQVIFNFKKYFNYFEKMVNFIYRKAQASFSWDWGPSFPTVGIWQPLSIEGFDTLFIDRFSANVKQIEGIFCFKSLEFISLCHLFLLWEAIELKLFVQVISAFR